jgi:hypothetical protein
MKFIFALLLLSCTGIAQNRDMKSEAVNVINWFHIRYFVVTDSMRLVTRDSNMYVWDERTAAWHPSTIMNGRKIGRVQYSDKYEFYSPMHVLRNVATGDTVSLAAVVPKHISGDVGIAFHDNTGALVVEFEIVYYNTERHEVMGRREGYSIRSSSSKGLLLTDTALYVLTSNMVFVYDRNSKAERSFRASFDYYTTSGQSGVRFGRWWVAGGTAIDLDADTAKNLNANYHPRNFLHSYYVYNGKVYSSRWVWTDTTYIEETDIETGETRILYNIPSYDMASMSCVINYLDDSVILLNDLEGGLYRYDRRSQRLSWCGDGIYEHAPNSAVVSGDSMWLATGNLVFMRSKGDVWMQHGTYLRNALQMSFYKDSIAILSNLAPGKGIFLIPRNPYSDGGIVLTTHTISFFVKDNTVLYISTRDYMYRYDGATMKYLPCANCRIVDGGEKLISANDVGELRTFTYADDSFGQMDLRIKDTEMLMAAVAGGAALVVQEDATVRSIEVSSGSYLWESPDTVKYINKVAFGDYELIALSNGQLVDPLTGDVLLHIGMDVKVAVMFMDTCFLFDNKGKAVKAWMERPVGIVRMQTDGNRGIDLYPNPGTGFVRISGLPAAAGEYNIALYDRLGRTVYSGSVTATSGTSGFDATSLNPGFYMLLVYDSKGALMHRKAFYRGM